MENIFEKIMSEKSDEELLKIVTIESEKYEPIAIETAQEILKKRNIDISEFEEVREKQKNDKLRNKQTEKQLIDNNIDLPSSKQVNRFWVYFGYVILLFTAGIYGIITGYILKYSKQKTEYGNDHFVYNKSTREEGKVMIILGCIVLVIQIIRYLIKIQ